MFTGVLATQRYKLRPYAMDIHGVRFCYETGIYTGAFRPDARFLHTQTSESNSVNGALFTGFLATRQYKVRPQAMDIHGVRLCYGSDILTWRFPGAFWRLQTRRQIPPHSDVRIQFRQRENVHRVPSYTAV